MKTVDQISRGVANFFDAEVRPSLPAGKQILYGIAVGRVAASLPAIIAQNETILTTLGIVQDGQIDAEGLSAELRTQLEKSGGAMSIAVLGDTFTFKQQDVDSLMRHIERA